MTHEPVSRPIGGVRVASGRSPAAPPPAQPSVDPAIEDQARSLLHTSLGPYFSGFTGTGDEQWAAVLSFAAGVGSTPSRPGARALAILAEVYGAEERTPDTTYLLKLSANVQRHVEWMEATVRSYADLVRLTQEAVKQAHAIGYEAGVAEVKKNLPAVLRETDFISDDKGRIVGKREREFKPGGNR